MSGEVRHVAYELRFREPIVTAKGRIEKRRGFLFSVDVGGKKYVSEAALLPEFGTEYFEHAERIVNVETTNFMSAPATLFGIDCIRWASDMRSHEGLEIPVAKLLHGKSDEEIIDCARHASDEGFKSAKLKVGVRETRDDKRLVNAIHDAAPGLRLRLDANLGWHALKLIKFSRGVASEAIEWFEDPFSGNDEWDGMRSEVGFPLASDEAFTPEQLKQSETWKKIDVLVVKPARYGPIAETQQICARARIEGKQIVFSSMYDSGVGLSHLATLASEYATSDLPQGLGTSGIFEQDLLQRPLDIREGNLIVPPLDELAGLLRPEWRERLGFTTA